MAPLKLPRLTGRQRVRRRRGAPLDGRPRQVPRDEGQAVGAYDSTVASMTDADREVEKLARLVHGHLTHVSDQLGEEVDEAPGSRYALELANSETGPAGKWGDEAVHTAMSLASLKLTAAKDHILSVHKLLVPPHSLYGLAVMARASVEASAKAFWLLDPNISVRERVGRSLGEQLYSAEEASSALALLIDNWKDPGTVDDIKAEAKDLGVKWQRPGNMTTRAGEVLRQHTERPAKACGAYMYMCAVAHSTQYATLQHLKPVGGAKDPRDQRVQGVLTLEGVIWTVSATLGAHSSAFERMLDYLGRNNREWHSWKVNIARQLTRASTAFKPGVTHPVGRSVA